MILNNELIFGKVRENAIIPEKTSENAGYDIYACFDEDYMIINSLETKLVPTGIATAFSKEYYAQIQERGSTGSKGLKYGAGVIDSGYRGEWFVAITNCNNTPVLIAKKGAKIPKDILNTNPIIYPYEKGIAQFVMHKVPVMKVSTMDYNELLKIESERGTGALGSSNK